ncbi:hypothetical protein BBK36DRAFT_1120046, partial [Trichoderma citrinoviride]
MIPSSGLPYDDSSPWSPLQPQGTNTGLVNTLVLCPGKDCESSSSDGTSVFTPAATDPSHDFVDATSTTHTDLQD